MLSSPNSSTTLPETNSSPPRMDGWKTFSFPFGTAYFAGASAVSFKEGIRFPKAHRVRGCHNLSFKTGLLLSMVLKSCGHQLRLVIYPNIYKVLYIPGGAGFQPSTVGCPAGSDRN